MDRFLQDQNIALYRRLRNSSTAETERRMIIKLLVKEMDKLKINKKCAQQTRAASRSPTRMIADRNFDRRYIPSPDRVVIVHPMLASMVFGLSVRWTLSAIANLIVSSALFISFVTSSWIHGWV